MKEQLISFKQALQLTLNIITPLDAETAPLSGLVNRVAACDLSARVNAPASDVSLKDGGRNNAARFQQKILMGGIARGEKTQRRLVENQGAMRVLWGGYPGVNLRQYGSGRAGVDQHPLPAQFHQVLLLPLPEDPADGVKRRTSHCRYFKVGGNGLPGGESTPEKSR